MKIKYLINYVIILGLMLTMQGICEASSSLKLTAYTSAHITVTGQRTGVFPPIIANAVAYSVVSPRDVQTGLPTGHRQHKPVTITKALSEASPMLFNALVTNENLTSVVIQFIAEDKSLGPRINLTNASIASFVSHSQTILSDKSEADIVTSAFNELEDVSFTFQKIEITYGNNTGVDDWNQVF